MQCRIVFVHIGMNPISPLPFLVLMEGSRVRISLVETLCGPRNRHPIMKIKDSDVYVTKNC
jgi:hypothetical protein